MNIIEELKETIKYKYIQCRMFFTKGVLPKTKNDNYWYEKALQDSFSDFKLYESRVRIQYQKKYDSLIKCLTLNHIIVKYNETTNTHHIEFLDTNKNIVDYEH